MRLAAAAVAIAVAAGPARAQQAPPPELAAEYDPYSQSWNGMASFVGLAEGMGFSVRIVSQLEWSEVGAGQILFLVFPLQRVDPVKLGAFIAAGGNAVIADDFGEGKDAMQAMGLIRAEVAQANASRFYEGRSFAPIANARGDHPLAREVGDVITNHPAVLSRVQGADTVVALDAGAIVVAGERGSGKFVAISDPSILINRMLQFPGNVRLTANIFNWLDRHGPDGKREATEIVLLRGDVKMYGEPRTYIDDPRAGELGRSVADLNQWLATADSWLLTPAAMKALAATLAALLLLLAMLALPVRRGPKIDGAWLRFHRPGRRDEPQRLVHEAERGSGSNRVLACILRDQVQRLLADITHKSEPLYTIPESQLVAELSRTKGNLAGVALARVYRRLRALPSRGQAAAPWSAGQLPRREFDTLFADVAELCRTLGADFVEPGTATRSPSLAPAQPSTLTDAPRREA